LSGVYATRGGKLTFLHFVGSCRVVAPQLLSAPYGVVVVLTRLVSVPSGRMKLQSESESPSTSGAIRCRSHLGGLVEYYSREAA